MVATKPDSAARIIDSSELERTLSALECSGVGERWEMAEAAGRSGLAAGAEPLRALLAETAPEALSVRAGTRVVVVDELEVHSRALVEAAGATGRALSSLFSPEALVLLERGVMD